MYLILVCGRGNLKIKTCSFIYKYFIERDKVGGQDIEGSSMLNDDNFKKLYILKNVLVFVCTHNSRN
jgi:hypothetical protein